MRRFIVWTFFSFLFFKAISQGLPYNRNSFGLEFQVGSTYSFSNYNGLANNLGKFSNNPRLYFGGGLKYSHEVRAKSHYLLSGILIKSRGNLIKNSTFLCGPLIQRSINLSIPVEYLFRHYKFYFGLGIFYDRMISFTSKIDEINVDYPFLNNEFEINQVGAILSIGYWKDLNNEHKMIFGLKNEIPMDSKLTSVSFSIKYLI